MTKLKDLSSIGEVGKEARAVLLPFCLVLVLEWSHPVMLRAYPWAFAQGSLLGDSGDYLDYWGLNLVCRVQGEHPITALSVQGEQDILNAFYSVFPKVGHNTLWGTKIIQGACQ